MCSTVITRALHPKKSLAAYMAITRGMLKMEPLSSPTIKIGSLTLNCFLGRNGKMESRAPARFNDCEERTTTPEDGKCFNLFTL